MNQSLFLSVGSSKVLSILLKVYKSRTYFPFEISIFNHSSECILSVTCSFFRSSCFDPILGSKAGGGVRESDFPEVMVQN